MHIPFRYSQQVLNDCARSHLTAVPAPNEMRTEDSDTAIAVSRIPNSCRELYEQYRDHYYGHSGEEDNDGNGDCEIFHQPDESRLCKKKSRRWERFLASVIFVYQHEQQQSTHRVGLNQFSDRLPEELPFSLSSLSIDDHITERDTGVFVDATRTLPFEQQSFRRLHQQLMQQYEPFQPHSFLRGLDGNSIDMHLEEGDASFWTLLGGEDDILNVADEMLFGIGKGSKNTLNPKGRHHHGHHHTEPKPILPDTKIRIPFQDADPFETPSMDSSSLDGNLLLVKPPKNNEYKQDSNTTTNDDPFAAYLNWATSENPDGVSIVHGAFDQVRM